MNKLIKTFPFYDHSSAMTKVDKRVPKALLLEAQGLTTIYVFCVSFKSDNQKIFFDQGSLEIIVRNFVESCKSTNFLANEMQLQIFN